MKKTVIAIFCLIMSLLLVACSNQATNMSQASESIEQTETVTPEINDGDSSQSETQPTVDTSLIGMSFAFGDYEYTIQENGTIFISGYTGDESEITIPLELDGYIVTGIADSAFSGNDFIKTLVVPGQIKSIGDEAFSGCSNLSSVTLEEGVESIGEAAFFYRDTPLVELNIADSVYKIGLNAFTGREVSRDVNGLEYIGNVVIDFADSFDGHITFDENTTGIADHALERRMIGGAWNTRYLEILDDTVEFPDGIRYIGTQAFLNQAYVHYYKIPSSVLEIGTYAMQFRVVNNIELYSDNDTRKIYGASGSIAEQYAVSNGLNFVITER